MRIPEELRSIVDESVTACNAHVVDLIVRGDHRRPVVEIYVDAESGVTTELCSEISRRVSAGVDAGGFLSDGYRLEVSSPGIDRPLIFPWQYRKHVGREIFVRCGKIAGTESEVRGKLTAAGDTDIRITAAKGKEMQIAFTDIHEAKVMPPW
jgi:ribosome maturation factor RimP